MTQSDLRLIDMCFVQEVEKAHFRTAGDTGANPNALLIWNCVRRHLGLKELTKEELPAYCMTHKCYHVIKTDYGCRRIESNEEAKKAFGL